MACPGIAMPFYLAHPRLERLERRIMREAEGGNSRLLMRILRHEAGHAIDNAYRLRRRRRWREVFGPASVPYPARYRARAGSRRYVQHLGEWYAQAHPTEDFAETFAVWLTPKSAWRKNYADWPALHKLKAVDELIASVREVRAPVRNRIRVEPLERGHPHARAALSAQACAQPPDPPRARRRTAQARLHRRADPAPEREGGDAAARARRACSPRACARALKIDPYSVDQVLRMLIERSERLDLYVRGNQRDARRYSRWMLERLTGLYSQRETPHLSL